MMNHRVQNVLGIEHKEKSVKVSFDEAEKSKALEFGYEYWDDPDYPGYAGYVYDGRWKPAARRLVSFFDMRDGDTVLDAGCGKGFLLFDIKSHNPKIATFGIDASGYALSHAHPSVQSDIIRGSIAALPFEDKAFDVVYSVDVVYTMSVDECADAMREIERVGKRAFVQVESYRNEQERDNLITWDCTARTVMSTDEWARFFSDIGYSGYYYWRVFL